MTRASPPADVTVTPVTGIRAIRPGDDLAALLAAALDARGLELARGDVLVVCQKAVSKAEGRVVALGQVRPGPFARKLAAKLGTDPRLVEVVLGETERIVRMNDHVLVCETRHGLVCANAGVDSSNPVRRGTVTLLPVDPDRSAARLRQGLAKRTGVSLPVIVTDTFGRPFREGQVDVAIGVAGMKAWRSLAGERDWSGRMLRASATADADMIAAAAGLVMRKASGVPAARVRGLAPRPGAGTARDLIRPRAADLFR